MKVLHAALADDDAFLRRFRAEAQAAAALNHPNIVAVYDWGDDDGAPYIVTEYLGGGSLRGMLDRGDRLDPVAGADDRARGDAGPRLRPPPRLRAPRHQAGQPPLRRRRAGCASPTSAWRAPWPRRRGPSRTAPCSAPPATPRPSRRRASRSTAEADVYSLGLVLIEARHRHGAVRRRHHHRHAHGPGRQAGRGARGARAAAQGARPSRACPNPSDRPDAGELGVALMASAEDLPRPEPLPLVDAMPLDDHRGQRARRRHHARRRARRHAPGRSRRADRPVDAPRPPRPPHRRSGWRTTSWSRPTTTSRRGAAGPTRILVALLAVLVGGGAAFAYTELSTPSHEIPDLEGETQAAATAAAEELGFEVEITESRRDGLDAGHGARHPARRRRAARRGRDAHADHLARQHAGARAHGPRRARPSRKPPSSSPTAGGFVAGGHRARSPRTSPRAWSSGSARGCRRSCPRAIRCRSSCRAARPRAPCPADLVGSSFDAAKAALEGVQLKAKQVDEFSDDVPQGR